MGLKPKFVSYLFISKEYLKCQLCNTRKRHRQLFRHLIQQKVFLRFAFKVTQQF